MNMGQMGVRLYGKLWVQANSFKYMGLQAAADWGLERDVIHIVNALYKIRGALKSVLDPLMAIWYQCEVSVWISNCTNDIVFYRNLGYEMCWENESECLWADVWEMFGRSYKNRQS